MSMPLLSAWKKTNLLPISFILKSHLIFSTTLLQPWPRRLSRPQTSLPANSAQKFRIPPLVHDSSSTLSITEEELLHFFKFYKHTPSKHAIRIHSTIIKLGLETHLLLCNNLITLYSKNEQSYTACKLFDQMQHRDIISWTATISALVQSSDQNGALRLYHQMLLSGLAPNHFTLSSIMRIAASSMDLDLGTTHHAIIIKRGFLSNSILESILLDFYSKSGLINEALQVIQFMDYRDTVSWTTIMSAMIQAEDWVNAFGFYNAMLRDRVFPNEFTFTKLFTACTNLESRIGEIVHGHAIIFGIELNLVVKTSLVNMYSRSSNMNYAERSLHMTLDYDVMLWTTMISGYAQAGDSGKVSSSFKEMQTNAAVSPNSFTYATLLNACLLSSSPEQGKGFHCLVVKVGFECDVSVGNAIVDLYAKLALRLEDVVNAFEEIRSPNVVSWTAFISGLVRMGKVNAAMMVLAEMQVAGVKPNSFTFSAILADLSAVDGATHVKKIHAVMLKTNSSIWDIIAGNSLVEAYAKLRKIDYATKVFDDMPQKDICTYNHGQSFE